jgi:outer membrane scaffolding protein for murein synthesis (MipA/OmpV family)
VLLSCLSASSVFGAVAMPAKAEDVLEAALAQSRFVLGATLVSSADYPGSARSDIKLRPLWAYQYGRWRLSTSRASAVLGFATDAAGPGASAELVSNKNWHLGAAFRFDGGRKASDSPDLHGLPDVARTLRGRLYTSYTLNQQWSIGANVSQDLLGRGGGALAGIDLGFRHWLTPRVEWTSGLGVTLADKRNMTTYLGINGEQASQSGLRPFAPGAGLRDVHLGVGLTTALTPHWIAFGNVGVSRLLADAAASPLTRRAQSVGATLGIAYRN